MLRLRFYFQKHTTRMRQDGSAFRFELSFGHSGTGAEMSVQFGPINPVPKCPGTEASVSQSSTRRCWWSTYVRLLITMIVRWVTDDRRTWCQHQLTYQSIIQQLHSNTSVNTSLYSPNDEPEETRMWANAQPDGRPAEHRWRPLFNAAKFGWRPLLDAVQQRCQNAKPVEICRGAPN